MSSILHPLQTASQKCRPKHQVLILKCYPKYQKNVQEVKPNSSELSYLLYYASTRRSKLQKVGAFLEKKTASDVWRQKLGNVQVTLQILTAIIEKAPRDLSLYSNSVFFILETVLRSNDINMIEETVPTWEAYCRHVDEPSLTADQQRSRQYLKLLEIYTRFSSSGQAPVGKNSTAVPLSIRWRTISLRAIRAAVGSDAIAADSQAQLTAVMPVILENLSLEDGKILHMLQQRAQTEEKQSTENARKRRMSVATVSTVDDADAHPAMASETTADADKLAEDEVRVLAVRCLKQIFSISTSSSRGQTRLGTALTLRFIASKYRPPPISEKDTQGLSGTWATSLLEAIARWTPVQDRFVIVITAMETLVRSPIIESVLEKQLVLANMIDHLLKSDINLIGLSVMDVLLGLIQHMLLLLQLGGRDSKIVPHLPQNDVLGIYREAKETFDPGSILVQPKLSKVRTKDESTASPTRREMLSVLQRCISDLGTHIYYTDQITDMLTAILARLKPSIQSDVASASAAIDDPAAATKAIVDSASLQEDPTTDGFFSFATARLVALKAVKDILITANHHKNKTGSSAVSRSRVGVQVWEGTQWLLKDVDQDVRFAYADALNTWLRFETNKSDLHLPKDGVRKIKPGKRDELPNGDSKLSKRAVSNASKKEPKPIKSTFYQLLHLAIYDNAIDLAESEADILLLHALLYTMVDRLGVNAVRTGLPVIMTLQSTVLTGDLQCCLRGKVNVASLAHAYFWTVAHKFDLETTRTGSEINSQVSKRKQYTIWCDKIRFPPWPVDQIKRMRHTGHMPGEISQASVDTMKPFLDVVSLVNEIAIAYDMSLLTPPSSPGLTPGRVFSVPTLGFGYGYGTAPAARPSPQDQMPQKVKDEMCGQWSRDTCIANIEKESTASVTGSRTGGSGIRQQHLAVNTGNGSISGRESPQEGVAPPMAMGSGIGSLSKQRYSGWSGSAIQLTNSSSRDSTMRVSDLKRALSGYNSGVRNDSPLRRPLTASRRSIRDSDRDSESMVSWNEADDQDGVGNLNGSLAPVSVPVPSTSPNSEAHTYHDAATLGAPTNHGLGDDVPPVPKIPSILNLPGTWPRDALPVRPQTAMKLGESEDVDAASPDTRRAMSASHTSVGSLGKVHKRGSRPASRVGATTMYNQNQTVSGATTSTMKSSLAGFLAGIDSGTNKTNGNAAINNEIGRTKVIAPPY